MRRLGILAAVLTLTLPAFGQEAAPADLQARAVALAREATRKTVCVVGVAGSGSGAVISGEGKTVTNAHVAAASRYAILIFSDGTKRLARRAGIDFERDLAIYIPIEAPAAPLPHFELAEARPAPGTRVATIGYPGGPKTTAAPAFSIGLVNDARGPGNVNGFLNYDDAITSDAPLFPGNSGGPMVSLDGQLLGINGAVNLAGGASYSIPIERVRDRLNRFKNPHILLPGGVVLDPEEQWLVKGLYEAIDPIVKRMMEDRLAEKPAPAAGPSAAPPATIEGFVESDELAERARATTRNAQLAPAFRGAAARGRAAIVRIGRTDQDRVILATRVAPRFAIAVASRLGDARSFRSSAGEARLVATAPAQDLALLRLEKEGPFLELADAPAIGSFVASLGRKPGDLAAGVLTVPARRVSARQALAMAQADSGLPAPLTKALKGIAKLAERFGQKDIAMLIEQIFQSFEMRQNYMRGSLPRGFESVLSHDAPLAPSEVGAPLIDTAGRLVGINVANAHYGTSYAAGREALLRAFPQLRGPQPKPQPSRGKARLY